MGTEVTGRITGAYRTAHNQHPSGWAFTLAFDEDVIAALKAAVPGTERSYDPETHEWWVSVEYQDTLLRLFPGLESYLRQLPLL